MPLNIVICGAGIGGLAAAGYLRAQHTVTILEKGQLDFSINDYGFSIIANAFRLLQKSGVKEENLDCVPLTHIWTRTNDNQEIVTKLFEGNNISDAPSIFTRRAKLQAELLRFATDPNLPGTPAKVLKGVKISSIDVDAGKVDTEDGQTYQGDLIIGADGVNSLARAAVVNESAAFSAKTHDLLAFMTQISIDNLKSHSDLEFLANPTESAGLVSWFGPEGLSSKKRILLYHISPHELQVVGYTTEKEFTQQFNISKSSIIKDVSQQRVLDEFAGEFNESLCRLFTYRPIDAWRIRDIDSINTWYRGKCVLIGDAAHGVTPHAGQGCNVTIEDAEALGYFLKDIQSLEEIPIALDKYVVSRKDRTRLVQRYSRQMGNILSEEQRKEETIEQGYFAKVVYGYRGIEHAIATQG